VGKKNVTTSKKSSASKTKSLSEAEATALGGGRTLFHSRKIPTGSAASLVKESFKALGPGLITGAADDDPGGIGTYSSVGAQFGYGMLWTMPFTYPLMSAIQEISARLGRVTGHGIAGNMRRLYPRWFLYPIVGLLLFANIINLGADIGAMGAAVNLTVGGPTLLYCILLAGVSLLLQIFIPYHRYAWILKFLTLSLLAYVGTLFLVKIDWGATLRGTFLPNIAFNPAYLGGVVAVLGTTISPYLFFWQAEEEVEEMQTAPREKALKQAPRQAPAQILRIKADTYLGMAISNLIAYSIILVVAATLNSQGKTDIESPAQAAEALRPLAGPFASLLFSAGILGTGLLALPVLAGSAAYAIGEALRWPIGLERKTSEAKAFYAVIALATLIGLLLTFAKVNPIHALVWSAIVNGITAAPVMCFMMLMASNRKVMGKFVLPTYLKILGWMATLIMALAAVGMLVPEGRGQ
jgi:NRAMP (natural resistance-associated macrophage protein)-like metal ion transporter